MCFARKYCWLLLFFLIAACGNNLLPSGSDERPQIQPDTVGPEVGQKAPDFTITDTKGNTVTLSSALASKRGVVLYFTMWCPICDSHMTQMVNTVVPAYPDVRFFAVDYVSGTVADAAAAQAANGFADLPVLADTEHSLLESYRATMGTTVVIDNAGIIRMNEDYSNGSRLQAVLAGLP